MIITCNCKHSAQDEFHGINKRVHNPISKDRKIIGYRCTVCGNIKSVKAEEIQEKKK
jgi:hypothetical protein